MFCSKCGTENPDNARFCEQCGAAMQQDNFGAGTDASRFAQNPGAGPYRDMSAQFAPVNLVKNQYQSQSFFAPYINMWKNYANFTGRTRVREFWMAYLVDIVIIVVLAVLSAISGMQGGGLAGLFAGIYGLYCFAVLCPSLAIVVRRLRDAGRPWPWIFISFVPVGGIVLIVFLCGRSIPDNGIPVV
jgi:uncharacterized membrane protein YhaH (DUF805 family)